MLLKHAAVCCLWSNFVIIAGVISLHVILIFITVYADLSNLKQENLQGSYSMKKMIIDGTSFPYFSTHQPYIDPEYSGNISCVVGGEAVLNCRVYNLGNKTVSSRYWTTPQWHVDLFLFWKVSWIRLSDLNLLTVGRYTYTMDLRWEGIHKKFSPDWKLLLTEAKPSDAGFNPNDSKAVSLFQVCSRIVWVPSFLNAPHIQDCSLTS